VKPPLFKGRDSPYADGHGWVVPKKDRSAEQTDAIGKFFKFMTDNDYHWARHGHLPVVKSVFDMPEFQSLPHRGNRQHGHCLQK
jgi:multiple sugar transport system substrate-binding protein